MRDGKGKAPARPRAHVNDASCLTAACHGDGKYMSKSLLIGEPRLETRYIAGRETEVQRNPTVRFVHEKHLEVNGRLAENELQLEAVRRRLEAAAGADFARIQAAARSVRPSKQRQADLRVLMTELGLAAQERDAPVSNRNETRTSVSGRTEPGCDDPALSDGPTPLDDALKLMRLEHLHTRLRQLDGLTCAACHGDDYERLFEQWRSEIDTYLTEAEASLGRVEQQLDAWRARGNAVPEEVTEAFEEARANVQFIRAGNGIHNKNYTLKLLDVSINRLDRAAMRLMP